MATELYAIGLVLVSGFIGSFGAIFLKKGANNLSLSITKLFSNWELLLGLFFYALPVFLFLVALRAGELSVLYPFVATIYIWISLLSMKFLGEKMNKWKWLGIISITTGVGMIGLGS